MYHECSPRMYGTQWEYYRGISNLSKVVGSEQSFEPSKSSSNIVTIPFQTPPGFCPSTAKGLESFQDQEHKHDQHQIEVPSWCFEFPKTATDLGDNFTNTTTKQDQPTSQFTSSLYPVAESYLSSSADCNSCSENYSKFSSCSKKHSDFQPDNMPYYDHISQEHDKLLRDDAATDERPFEISFQRNQLPSCTKLEKQVLHRPCGVACGNSSNSASRRGKRRIRWTKDLHEPFMMIVNSLGGPEKAKPKAILEMMKSDLLSISHVKSHLQKCRSTIQIPKALLERSEEGQRTNEVNELQVKIHMQIEESRQLQLEIRKSIGQQLEMQRNLQMLIEQQSKQLKVMLEYQKERTKLLTQNWK
ncbi:protein PHOSPHATE STARVATION RESPONSE 1-like [Abrus precatorius]|uniref:Protein PHOSPHATE STARVATION RESPONSE 1-like n=1 Tax=Abrus precatorius TaxID=3816 RepID=A0A8B8L4F8_ABRPR|nr:protein PHOSPHATE STARVATION RESPONSE 1-like [Abrus precatorius]